LLLRLRRVLGRTLASTAATATPATSTASRAFALRRLRLWLLLLWLLLRPLRATIARFATFARTALASRLSSFGGFLLLVARRALSWWTAFFVAALLARPLLELLQLALHELADLRVLFHAHFVMAAIRATTPPLGVRLLARTADHAFGKRHRKRRALYTSAPMPADDRRRATLLTLIELAEGNSPTDCWDDQRAAELLRSQSTPEELRELGMSELMIERIFAERP
jgi:hypothetical protein